MPAESLALGELAALFREGFSDYQVPLALDEAAFAEHVAQNDIDLACSRVALAERPAALALIARRAARAWIGGMATVPAYRRRGLGERALLDAIGAAARLGCEAVWLEVLEDNEPALTLYEKLGFERVRALDVWILEAPRSPAARPADAELAHRWITSHRLEREPWQRADETIAQMENLSALVVERAGETVAAAVYRDRPDATVIMQAAAVDDSAAGDALPAGARPLRFANVQAGSRFSRVLAALGARRDAGQFELLLKLRHGVA